MEKPEPHSDELRPFIKRAVAKMAQSAGFETAENDALETLVELYGALIHSIAEISKEYCEHGNRSVPMIQDIIAGTLEIWTLNYTISDSNKRPWDKVFCL